MPFTFSEEGVNGNLPLKAPVYEDKIKEDNDKQLVEWSQGNFFGTQ